MNRPRRALATIVVVASASGLAGCGDDTSVDPPSGQGASFPASSDPVDASGLIWSSGSTVHLSDGTDIELGEEPDGYVVGGDGVFFTTTGDPGVEEAAVENAELFFADRDGQVTSVATGVTDPFASPDGRYLVYLDVASGEQDAYGTPQAQTVIADLASGEEVVRSTEGAGDPSSDDFADLYSEGEIRVRRVTDEVAYVDIGGTHEFDLATGAAKRVPVDDFSWDVRPADPRSPDGDWRIVETEDVRDEIVGTGGRRIVPDVGTQRWDLKFWADDRTVAGYAIGGPIGPQRQPFSDANTYTLFSCEVPSGRCATVPETTGETYKLPTGDFEF